MRAQVSLKVGALEVGFLAAGEVADVVPPAGEVGLGGAATWSRWHVDRCRGQWEELGAAQGHHSLRWLRRLGDRWLRNHKHHRRTHQQRRGEAGGRLGQDGLGRRHSLDMNRSLDEGGDHPSLAAHRENLAEDRRRGGGGGRQGGGGRGGWAARRRRRSVFVSVLWKRVRRSHLRQRGGKRRRKSEAEAVGSVADDAGGHSSAGRSHTGRLHLRVRGGVQQALPEGGEARMRPEGGAQSGGGGGEDSRGGGLCEAGTVRRSHALTGQKHSDI